MGGHRAGRAMLYPALLLSVLLVGQVTPKSHSSHQKPVTLLGLPKQQKYLLAGAHAAIQSWANVSESSKCKPPSSLPAMTPRDESLANGSFAVCVMALNEGNFVAEFIDFYLMQNAAHIFFYVDSGTTDNTKDVLAPYVAAGKVTLHDWPPERGSAMANGRRKTAFSTPEDVFVDRSQEAELRRDNITSTAYPLEKIRTFDPTCGVPNGRKTHCAGHHLQMAHCARRAQEMAIKWGGMLDIDEFWFSQRFVTLERLLAHKYKLGYHGIGQTSMSFLAGPADGPCSELPPVVATHLWRSPVSVFQRKGFSKFTWVRLDKVKQSTLGVHESDFFSCTSKGSSNRHCKGPVWSPVNADKYAKPVAACCEVITHVPTIEELQWNHYGAKSKICAHEKAMKNRNSSSFHSDLPQVESFWSGMHNKTVCDTAILPHLPVKYNLALKPPVSQRCRPLIGQTPNPQSDQWNQLVVTCLYERLQLL